MRARWDAFLSYSSRDAAVAGRVQRFLEGYRVPGGRRLRVYRDETDIEGGELPGQLRDALAESGCLLVCCSEEAAGSEWVAREIDAFREARPTGPVLPVLVAGEPPANLPAPLRGQELRWSDLRPGWRFGRPRRETRQELVRAVAAVSGIPFRELLPLDRLRRRRTRVRAAVALLAAAAAAASVPVLDWAEITPGRPGMIAGCGTHDGAVALYHMNEAQATTNIVLVLSENGDARPLDDMEASPRGRLLPGSLGAFPGCAGPARSWVGEPEPGVCVGLFPSEEMLSLVDRFGGTEAPATEVAVGSARAVLDRIWSDPDVRLWDGYGRTVTPSAGVPVWAEGRHLWLGFPADEVTLGGLWHSTDDGGNWEAVRGLRDVRSIRHTAVGTLVAGRWDGELGFWVVGDTVEALDTPGKGDDLEICGEEDGQPVVRVDRTVHRRLRVPWWKARLGGGAERDRVVGP